MRVTKKMKLFLRLITHDSLTDHKVRCTVGWTCLVFHPFFVRFLPSFTQFLLFFPTKLLATFSGSLQKKFPKPDIKTPVLSYTTLVCFFVLAAEAGGRVFGSMGGGGLDSDEVCIGFLTFFTFLPKSRFTFFLPCVTAICFLVKPEEIKKNVFLFSQDESGSLSSGESDIGVDDDDDELIDDDDVDEGRGGEQDDGSQANSVNDSDNDF